MSDGTRVITPELLRGWPLPQPDGDKHARGTVLAVGGARATPGALLLSALAALRMGAGIVQLVCHPDVVTALAVAVPEARVLPWPQPDDRDDIKELVAAADTVLVGPGFDDIDQTLEILRQILPHSTDTGLVLDAYALGALSREPGLLHDRQRPAVLTPSSTEAAVLLHEQEVADLGGAAATIARSYRAIVALRGHVSDPDGRHWREEGGDVGLGTAGSGDVFAGLVAGLLARGAEVEQAVCWASHVHATAGQRLAAGLGRTGFLARELVAEAPRILASLQI